MYPGFRGNRSGISIIMVSEAPPVERSNYFDNNAGGTFFLTTQIAFKDAGIDIRSYDDITRLGIYLTTAIKCPKADYLVSSKTIRECAGRYLGDEILGFPNVKIIMCMGDVAIKAVNHVFKSRFNAAPIKKGSTYKIRKERHVLNGIIFMPSYTQTGDSFNIEKSKRKMIAEDIACALRILKKECPA